jgi:hypothetical protein
MYSMDPDTGLARYWNGLFWPKLGIQKSDYLIPEVMNLTI